jgi:hypothetical protein
MLFHKHGLPVKLININMDCIDMTKITFELDSKLDERFRKVIADTKGLHRGVIQEAIEEAIENWIVDMAKGKK